MKKALIGLCMISPALPFFASSFDIDGTINMPSYYSEASRTVRERKCNAGFPPVTIGGLYETSVTTYPKSYEIVKVQADNPYAFSGGIKYYIDCNVRTQKKSGCGGALEWTRDNNRSGSVTVDINFIETIQGGVKKVAKVIGQDRWGTCGTAIVNKFNGMNG